MMPMNPGGTGSIGPTPTLPVNPGGIGRGPNPTLPINPGGTGSTGGGTGSSPIPSNLNGLVIGILAVVAIVVIALALSGTNKTVATIIQGGLVIAILAVLVRDYGNKQVFAGAIRNVTNLAVGTTGKSSNP